LEQPKFGEFIAFSNIIKQLPPTSVDEEQIAAIIKNNGYMLKYVPQAVVYNKGPDTVREFLRQRRRIYCGHLLLKKYYNYEAATLSGMRILKYLLKNSFSACKKSRLWFCGAIFLELTGRVLGRLDALFKKNHYKWKIVKSTKCLNDE
jgi:cellulose synthase/poly-beta-1,6-N-acetylglucosamine synthase-like glycosyltransferase